MSIGDLQSARPLPEKRALPAPLLPVALGLILGIVVDSRVMPAGWMCAVLLAVGAGLAWSVRRVELCTRPPRLVLPIGFVAVMVAATGVGALRHAVSSRYFAENHIVFFTKAEPMLAELHGRVLSPPRIREPAPGVLRAYPVGPKTRFVMEVTAVAGVEGALPACGKVAVVVKGAALFLHAGDEVALTGWVYRPPSPSNPGAYDWARHQRRNGLLVGMSCAHAESIVVRKRGDTGGWRGWLSGVRTRLRGYLLDDAFEEGDPGAGVVAAMVLGQRSEVPRAMNEAFVKTGNAHFLAASGMHVAWLALLGWGICRIFGLYYRTTAVVVGVLILSFVLIAEPRPSIMRAGIIGVLACVTAFTRGRYNSVNALACAAALIVLVRPADVFRPAFQFSFMATLGLLHFCPLVAATMARWLLRLNLPRVARLFDPSQYPLTLIGSVERGPSLWGLVRFRLAFIPAQLLALSLTEWAITAPLSCYHFNQFVPWGWFGTFVLFFLAMPTVCLGYLTVLLRLVLPSSGVVLGPVLGWVAGLMVGCVGVLARISGTMIDGRSPSLVWLTVVYVLMWIWGYRRAWMCWKHGFKVGAVVLAAWWFVAPLWSRGGEEALRVWVLRVGDGCGIVVELPDDRVIVYDFGTRSPFDAGRVGVAFLEHRGVRRLDAVFVSHANFDHFSGVETLAEHFAIGRLVINDQFERFAPEGSSGRRFLDSMIRSGIPVEVTHGRHTFEGMGDATVEAIWPPSAARQPVSSANESSTVLRIAWQGRSILLTGDIGENGLSGLMQDEAPRADALLLPHHGGVVGNTGRFIASVCPDVVVRSSGQRRAMTTTGIASLIGEAEYLTTADDGCILLEIRDGELTAKAVMAD